MLPIEIINNTRVGIEGKIWERGYSGAIIAKVVAKEALAQPISAWPCIRDLNLPPKKRVPFCFQSKKNYDASSSVIYNLYGAASLRGGGAATRRNVASAILLHSVFNYMLIMAYFL